MTLVAALVPTSATVNAAGTCPDGGGWTKIDSDNLSSYPVAGADDYCFKAGPFTTGSIPAGGFGQEGACTEDHIERCGLSHWSWHASIPTDIPEPTPTTPVPTNTVVPSDTPIPSPTPETPTITPEPSKTPTNPPNTPTPETPTPTATTPVPRTPTPTNPPETTPTPTGTLTQTPTPNITPTNGTPTEIPTVTLTSISPCACIVDAFNAGSLAGLNTTSTEQDDTHFDWDPFILGLLLANTLGVFWLLIKNNRE